jgi:16S rRNA (cytidine1402-2'-O)-methyltransferase
MEHRRERVANEREDSIARQDGGVLFVVATPIGNLGDLSPRARDTLRDAQWLLAEDTRHTAQLLHACAIERPPGRTVSLHEHNERGSVVRLVTQMQQGATIALVSDAGTPLVSDPGAALVRAAIDAGIELVSVPGPCAAIAALTLAGLPADRFAFEGFLPAKHAARVAMLRTLAHESRTLVFYEAPHRLRESLDDLAEVLGADRAAAVLREITKRFESAYRGTLGALATQCARDTDMSRGEIVLVVAGVQQPSAPDAAAVDALLGALLDELPASQAARIAARVTGRPRKELYERALSLGRRPAT